MSYDAWKLRTPEDEPDPPDLEQSPLAPLPRPERYWVCTGCRDLAIFSPTRPCPCGGAWDEVSR